MAKRRRYKLTETQLTPVIRFINEEFSNYPAGVTDFNIDRLSGAGNDVYEQIRDVTLKPNGNLIFDIVTDRGHTVEKEIWLGDDQVIRTIEPILPQFGYNLREFPEWEVTNATMQGNNVVLDIIGDGHMHQVVVDVSSIFGWLPELEPDEIEPAEPDYDEMRERGGW